MLFWKHRKTSPVLSAIGFIMLWLAWMLNGRLITSQDSCFVLAMSSVEHDSDASTLLTPGKKVTRESTSTGSYRIGLTSGQYLRITATQSAKGVEFILYDPGGDLVCRVRGRSRGLTPISVIAESPGDYKLAVSPLNNSGPPE